MLNKADNEDAGESSLPYRQHFDDSITSEDQDGLIEDLIKEENEEKQKN